MASKGEEGDRGQPEDIYTNLVSINLNSRETRGRIKGKYQMNELIERRGGYSNEETLQTTDVVGNWR